jgi:hypothetical protein
MQRERWARALELAREAASGDSQGRTAGVLVFLGAQAGEPAEEEEEGVEPPPPPTREEVDAALDASLMEYRRMHADDRRLAGEDLLG